MIKLVKVSNLYVGCTAYKTDKEITDVNDKKNIIAENIDGYTIMKEPKREIFVKKGRLLYNIMDIGKKHKLSRKYAYPVSSVKTLDKIKVGKDTIIEENLKKLDLLSEVASINNDVANYFYDNSNSERVLLEKVKKVNSLIR